jgi:CheY-like chemotaxis protein
MGRSKKKILLIDESIAGLMVGKMILGRDAYDVVTARTGREGLEKAFAERPDLIVLSAGSAATAGPHDAKTCEALRAHDGTRATPILLVTTRPRSGSSAEGDGGRLRSASEAGGSCDYVTKPVSGLELLTKVRCGLGERHERRGEG